MNPRNRIWWLVGAVLADRFVTLHHFHMEANPVVNGLGALSWTLLTIGVVTVGVYLWLSGELWEYRSARLSVTVCSLVTATAVALNLLAVGA